MAVGPSSRAVGGGGGSGGPRGAGDDGDECSHELRLSCVVDRVRRAIELSHRACRQPCRHVVDAALALPLAHGARLVRHPQVHGDGARRLGELIPRRRAVGGGEHPLARQLLRSRVDVTPPAPRRRRAHALPLPRVDALVLARVPSQQRLLGRRERAKEAAVRLGEPVKCRLPRRVSGRESELGRSRAHAQVHVLDHHRG
mmetsp:Transcript_22993/g.46792  ORF Transcript_22993/g.46792 Transcript_22993/m.46792 type:complete len:200 (-) Transcript_22993:355-954(-)